MANYRNKRTLPIILVIIIVVVAIAALVSLARAIFFSGDSTGPNIDTSQQSLLSSDESRSVSMTVRGPIVADEEFASYQIVISPSSRTLTTYSGYLDAVVEQVNLNNNVAAYEQFVYALDRANMMDGKELEAERNDVRGICATGRVYEFRILEDGSPLKMLWSSTCRGSSGSLRANTDQLRSLFTAQIPDGEKVINNTDI